MADLWLDAALAVLAVALLAGPVGYLLVLRNEVFAGHALSHLGFTGAAGALLLGAPPLAGMVLASMGCGVAMGALGARARERDVAIGVVLTVGLGFGLLFLSLYTAQATQATALLFGSILGVGPEALVPMAALAGGGLLGLMLLLRPLLLASLQPELAAARGVPVRLLAILFLALVGLAVAEAAQIVGVLLVFALMAGPGAAAYRLSQRVGRGLLLSAALAVLVGWGGLWLSDLSDWPVSFWICLLSGTAYLAASAVRA